MNSYIFALISYCNHCQ